MRLPGICRVCRLPVIWNGWRWVTSGTGRKHTCYSGSMAAAHRRRTV